MQPLKVLLVAEAMSLAHVVRLVTLADSLSPDELVRRADALSAIAWPGAPDAALFVAEWQVEYFSERNPKVRLLKLPPDLERRAAGENR